MAAGKVAIIGGGPAGSTLGTFLKLYMPELAVTIFEREKFPRDHIGESQVPAVCAVLYEMGVWDKVEAAGFPIKIGATYRWGTTNDLWDFEFLPGQSFNANDRPATFEGQRAQTAWQVDRSIYDKILLDHAAELGCEVHEETKVADVLRSGDRVEGFKLDSGDIVTADYYIDASGNAATLRRAMGVETEEPTVLRNVAFWDYWRDAEWAVKIGKEGTRIQVMSLGYGWIWFITIGSDRTSLGLVVPAEYYKKSGKKPEDLYLEAVHSEPRISSLIKSAKREGKFTTTKDWSYLSERLYGENWFLVGECAGFADPILSQGLTLAQTGARHLAYTIMSLERGKLDRKWLLESYNRTQLKRILQHIRFADFWYSSNGHFTDLVEYTRQIAKEGGLELTADQAFRWLGTGGFMNDDTAIAGMGQYNLTAVKQLTHLFTGTESTWEIGKNNIFRLNFEGAEQVQLPLMRDGYIHPVEGYARDGKVLPHVAFYGMMIDLLAVEHRAPFLNDKISSTIDELGIDHDSGLQFALDCLETMIHDGWVTASRSDAYPLLPFVTPDETRTIHWNRDAAYVPTVKRVEAS